MSSDVRGQRHSWSNDGDLADEIRIYGDLVVAASESDGTLSVTQIDAALGLATSGAAGDDCGAGSTGPDGSPLHA